MDDGRWLNTMDDAQKRAVVVIGDEARKVFSRAAVDRQHDSVEWNPVSGVGTLERMGHGDNNNATSGS